MDYGAGLTLITPAGIGNHSKGHAAIPTAVRSYLDENRLKTGSNYLNPLGFK